MELPYERQAMRGEPMPSGLNISDQSMYQGLVRLYERFLDGKITRDQAGVEKREMVRALEKAKQSESLSLHSANFFKTVEWYAADYQKNRTLEAADRLVDAVNGFLRGIPNCNDRGG